MADKRLVRYMQRQLKRGFDAQTIRNYLIQYNYPPSEVDEALRQVYSPEVRHVIHFSPTTLIAITIIFVATTGGGFFAYTLLNPGTPETLLDLSLESVATTAKPGEQLKVISEVDNLGSAERYDAQIKYELINLGTNEVIQSQEEARAVETKSTKNINLKIPEDADAGSYMIRAIATYNGQRAVATISAKISDGGKTGGQQGKEPPQDEPPQDELPEKEPPQDEPPEDEPQREPQPTTGDDDKAGEALTTFDTIKEVEKIAGQNPSGAEALCRELKLQTSKNLCYNKLGEVTGDRKYCGRITDQRTQDICVSNVAKLIGNSTLCEEISKDSRKDNCYMSFALEKEDYSVCPKVTNQYLRQSCKSLEQLSKQNLTNTAFYESLVNQSLIELRN